MSFILLDFISLCLEAKSSTKVEDEASPFIYLHVFVFSLILNPSFNVLFVRFNSVSWQNCVDCCLWIVKRPIFVMIRPGVHQMIQSISLIKYPLWFFNGEYIGWFD